MPDDRKSFLRDFVSLGSGTEIPPLFLLWSGVAGVSAVLGRRCWIDMGTFIVYPNEYIVLVAGAGRCRKGTSIGLIERLVRSIDPPVNLIPQIITREALIDSLRQVSSADGKVVLAQTAEGFAFVDELINFLNKKNYESGFGGMLISLYDCIDPYEYKTIARGREKLHRTCLGILSATTIDWIRMALPLEAIGGGLTSRIVLVYVENPAPPVPRPRPMSEKKELVESLIRSLSRIHMLHGEVSLDDKAKEQFDRLYIEFYTKSLLFTDPTTTAYASRRHSHLLKLAMILAASEEGLLIEERHILGAHEALKQTEQALTKVLGLITSSDKGMMIALIRGYVQQHKRISRTALLQIVAHRVDSRELTDLMDTLIHAHQVRCASSEGTIYYEAIN